MPEAGPFAIAPNNPDRDETRATHLPSLDYKSSQSGTRHLPKYVSTRGELYVLGDRGVIDTGESVSLAVRSDARVTLKLRMRW